MTKILIVFTGGTIGSSINDGTISPDVTTKYCLINNYIKDNGSCNVEFTSVEPYTILSENLAATHINALVDCIGDNLDKGYDGIIVTHGTDTLQFTAVALEYAFADVNIPIMLVSSNLPLSEEGSNGNANFAGAVNFIINKVANGVFVSYRNDGEKLKFHSPHSILMHQEASDNVVSIAAGAFATLDGNEIILNPFYKARPNVKGMGKLNLNNASKILVTGCYPGDAYVYNLDNYKAVIFRPYHSGTLNTADDSIRAFCDKVKAKNIPAFVVNVPCGNIYESSVLYKDMGLVALPESTFADTYVRVWIAISNGFDIKEFLK